MENSIRQMHRVRMYRVKITPIPANDRVGYDTLSNEFICQSGYKTVPDMTRILMKYFEDPSYPYPSNCLIEPIKGLDVGCLTPTGIIHYNYIDFYCNGCPEEIYNLDKGYFRVPISDDEEWIVEFINHMEIDLLRNSNNSVTYFFKGEEYNYEFPFDNNERTSFHRDAYEQYVDL